MKKKHIEIVANILKQNAGKEFCHECLGSAADIDSTAIVYRCALQLINNPFFGRRRGRCEICTSPRTKLLVRYKGAAPPLEHGGSCASGGAQETPSKAAVPQEQANAEGI
jgi:hypothetical protein